MYIRNTPIIPSDSLPIWLIPFLIAQRTGGTNDDISMAIAICLLGFSTYKGFSNNDGLSIDFMTENCGIERIYQ